MYAACQASSPILTLFFFFFFAVFLCGSALAGLGKMFALATLSNLEHDTAALRIQTVIRGSLNRKETTERAESGELNRYQ